MAFVAMTATPSHAEAPMETLVRTSSASETGPMDRQKACLAEAVFKEAGAEPAVGRLAVAHVILNRTRSGIFPKTVCGVVNQKGQFTYKHGGGIKRGAERQWAEARAVATLALSGTMSDVVKSALFFQSVRRRPSYSLRQVARIGGHAFYVGR
jgi:N-acetylmuramoyl-L-alanine amidase